MDISNGRLGFTQDLDNQKFLNALRQSTRGVTDFNIHLQNNFNQSLVFVNDLAKGVTAFLTIDMARDFITQMVKIRGEFEQTEIAFNTMLQSREKGNALMQEMVELAKNTPMQFSEVSQGAKQLLAYQVEAEKLTGTLSMLGDISSGLGVPMSRLILVYGQVRAKGRLMGDDLRQFTEAGVPMIAMIAKNMGIAQSAVADMVSEGKVGFKEVEKVLEQLTSQGGLFYNMMEEQSKTIPGQIAKLEDEIEQMFNNIGKDSQGFVTSVISGVSVVVENYESIGKTLGVLIGTYGAYKAALITVSSIEAARAKTVYSELESLSRKDRVQLLLTERSVRHAQATLAEAQAEHVKNQAVLTTMRTEIASTNVKRQKAIASANEARNNVVEAQTKLTNARAELASIEMTGTARQVTIAQKRVEKAENAVLNAQETQSIAIKNKLTQTTAYYASIKNVENQAKKTSISQTVVANAQEAVSVTTKNLNSAATARLTLFQNLQVVSTKAWTKAQAMLNATMLTNPYVLLTVAVIGLTAAITKMILQATYAEEIQDKLNETLSSHRQNVAATEAEIQTLVEAIKSENTTNEEKESLLKKIVSITDGKIQNLSVEKIKTGELDAQLQNYIKTLYKQAEAEAYLEDIKELTKKKAANNDRKNKIQKDGPGFWESAESLIDANSWKNGNYKEILRSDHDFGKTIIKNIDAENAAIDEAIKERKKLVTEKVVVDKEIIKEPSGTAGAIKDSKKKSTSTKKADDPFEIYKKQIQSVKEDYERFVNYMNSDDLVLKNSGKIQYESLSKSGATYEEFLRRLQKQLVGTSNKSALQVKQLQFINDELLKTIDYNAFDKFKEGIENSISESENLLEVLGKIQEEKLKLQGNTDQISIDKLKFLDEKEIENIKKADDAAKDLIRTLTEEYTPLDAINKKFDEQLFLLKNKILNANDEVDRLLNESNSLDNSLPENADKKVQIEEKILQIRKQILVTQNAIEQSEKNREKELKNTPTNNTDYNLLLKNYQDFNAQKKTIEDEFETNLKTIRNARLLLQNDNELKLNQSKLDELLKQNEDTENEIVRQKKKSLSKIALEQMKSSESYMKLMTKDLDKMTVESLEKIIEDLEDMLNNPDLGMELSPEDFKVIIDQIRSIKDEVNKAKPWKGISEGWDKLFNSEDSEDKLEGVGMLIDGMNTYFDALKQTIDMADEAIEAFGGNIDDSVKETIQHVQNIVNSVGNAIQGYFSGNYAQMVAGIVQVVVEVAKILGGSKDKRLEKRIKKQQQAVNDLKRAYDDLSFAIDRALGGKEYSMQKDQIKNLEEQKVLMEQMIKNEEKKKKTDRNKINEWNNAIADIDRQIKEIQENIANDILQTSAKELASTLGDALAEAFGKGEDAAKSFEKVANDVLKNAVLNQLKKRFIEEELQKALDQLEKDMGVDEKGWDGLSPEEQQEFRDKIKEISQNFQEALEQYSDLFKDLTDPNETAMAGAIKGMSEETGNALLGQFNAIRILQKELVTINIDSNKILLNSLDRLANIDYNTRSVLPLLEKLINRIDNAGRAYGF